ncbi:MAG TPA: ABC transporter permease [Bryobacteraceae bacterium]|nr:ABC transporter permease [Bryobacteraceae bacterium]
MTLWSDLRYGARLLRKSPGSTAISVVTLAFGIGVTTATFSTADGMMWKPIPLRDIGQMAVVLQRVAGEPDNYNWNALGDLSDIQKRTHAFTSMAWWVDGRANIVGAGGEPERVSQYLVSPNFFDVMEQQPAIGRGFLPGEDEPGRDRETILSDALWRRRFGADPAIVGQNIRMDDASFLVVGVMPPKFEFPKTAELWTPLALKPEDRQVRDHTQVMVVGRLRPGYTAAAADAEVAGISAQLEREYPATNKGRRYGVMAVQDFLVGYYNRQYLNLLLGAVVFVLLIACANVASLQLARALGRGREIALRTAVGAARGRLVRQLLTESVMVAVAGGLFGLLVASWSLQAILGAMPPDVARYVSGWNEIRLDGRALGMTLAASLLAGILAGLAPAFQCSRPNLAETLKEGGRGNSSSRGRHRLRAILVAAEMAMAVVLLVGAGLMARTFRSVANASASLEPKSLLTLRLAITETKYHEKVAESAFYREVLDRIAALPGVRMAAAASAMPYTQHSIGYRYEIEGQPGDPAHLPEGEYEAVSPSYFATVRVPLRNGRLLQISDGREAAPVAVIDELAARRWFPNADPVGRRIRQSGDKDARWMTIVGVVGNTVQSVYDRGPRAMLFVPFEQQPHTWMDLAVRTAGNPLVLAPSVTAAVRAVDREQPVTDVATMQTLVEHESTGILYVAGMLAVFGILALGLAAIAVYGMMAYLVNEQTQEIGIRMALGAPRNSVLLIVFRRGLAMTLAGIAIGIVLAFGMARLMAALFWGVSASDPLTFVGIPLVLIAAACFAIYVPARRAVHTDPMVALRYD